MKKRNEDQPVFVYEKLPNSELPVNRLRENGPGSLSLTELLSILIGEQTPAIASAVLSRFPMLKDLTNASERELTSVHGVGRVAAARLHAALELSRRMAAEIAEERFQVRDPNSVGQILMPMIAHHEQEHFVVVLMDTRNRILKIETLYVWTLNTTAIRPGEVFRCAIRINAASVIVAHNHSSGDPAPSPEDVALTRRLVEVGKMVEVDVLDHLVIGQNRFVSLRERNLGFES